LKSPTSPRITNGVGVSDYIMDSKLIMFLVPSQRQFELVFDSCNRVLWDVAKFLLWRVWVYLRSNDWECFLCVVKFIHSDYSMWLWFFFVFRVSMLYSCVLCVNLIYLLIGWFLEKNDNVLNWWCIFPNNK